MIHEAVCEACCLPPILCVTSRPALRSCCSALVMRHVRGDGAWQQQVCLGMLPPRRLDWRAGRVGHALHVTYDGETTRIDHIYMDCVHFMLYQELVHSLKLLHCNHRQ